MTHIYQIAAGLVLLAGTALAAGPMQGPIQGPVQGPVQAPLYKTETPVCCDRAIAYRHHHPRHEPCGPRQEVVLLVKDPCECCLVQVPVCIPCCCKGEPTVDCHKGVLCRSVTEYSWCCGYKVRVVMDHKGCVTVHYNVVL